MDSGIKGKRNPTGKRSVLFDVNESNKIGDFEQLNIKEKTGSGFIIEMDSSKQINCNDKDTWDKLAKPYMDE